jgi:hypothetical protein
MIFGKIKNDQFGKKAAPWIKETKEQKRHWFFDVDQGAKMLRL